MDTKIRIALPTDAPELLNIYAPYVENTPITFEYTVPSVEEFEQRIRNTLQRYPYLVADTNGIPVGYAYASAFKTRAAYSWSVETSIYVKQNCRGQKIGQALYKALEEILCRQNICNLCACISYPNPDSIAFHEALGYKTVAHFHKSGYKQDCWYDMVWMEKELCPHEIPPKEFIPFPALRNNSM